jgi:chemotaxis protein methyltransferase CheR
MAFRYCCAAGRTSRALFRSHRAVGHSMKDVDCVAFLQWALPRMQLSWPGFRKVRRSVCKRIDRRCRQLGLSDISAYRDRLSTDLSEWDVLRARCAISISRFYRDRAVFESLEHVVLPALAASAARRTDASLECWSAGCASGEEAYTLLILWRLALAETRPHLDLRVLATDIDAALLKRAAAARYRASTLNEAPLAWRDQAFDRRDNQYCLRAPFREAVRFVREDICETLPAERFDLILCRNLVFTYFSFDLQMRLGRQLIGRLHPGGALVIGLHESLPTGIEGVEPWADARAVFRRTGHRIGAGSGPS